MNTREAAVDAAQESLAVRGGGGSSWTLKIAKVGGEMGRKEKLERRGGQVGSYVLAKRRGLRLRRVTRSEGRQTRLGQHLQPNNIYSMLL